jgi:hypothetical protein
MTKGKPAMHLAEAVETLGRSRVNHLMASGVLRRRTSVNGRKPTGLWFDRLQVLEILERGDPMTNGEKLLKKATDNLEWATRMMKESVAPESVDINRVVVELGAALRVRLEERQAELAGRTSNNQREGDDDDRQGKQVRRGARI